MQNYGHNFERRRSVDFEHLQLIGVLTYVAHVFHKVPKIMNSTKVNKKESKSYNEQTKFYCQHHFVNLLMLVGCFKRSTYSNLNDIFLHSVQENENEWNQE